jgi:energy-coupling factor transport system ATP-binding protein
MTNKTGDDNGTLLRIEHLTFTYPGGTSPALKKISLLLQEGDFCALTGNNGSGKSTLCKVIVGLIPQYISGDYEGSVWIGGAQKSSASEANSPGIAGYVMQDYDNQIVCPRVNDEASFTCLHHAMPDYRQQGLAALEKVGLLSASERYVWQLSGGERHLLALAGCLAVSPRLLLLDEPISQLDSRHATRIYELLQKLNQEGITIVVAEHHAAYIARYCKTMVLMGNGEILWQKSVPDGLRRVEDLLANKVYPPQITLAAWRWQQSLKSPPLSRPLPLTPEDAVSYFHGIPLKEPRRPAPTAVSGETAIELRGVSVDYALLRGKRREVFHGLDLCLRKGEKTALIGNNGAGKSTLLKLIAGFIRPTVGDVFINGNDTATISLEKMGRTISFVLQNPEEMFLSDSIRGDIAYAMKASGVPAYAEKTEQLLRELRLEVLADRDGRLLSGGQMRRVSLAIGVASNPEILLLDEPTASLDVAAREDVLRCINQLSTETVVIASHDMDLICAWADRLVVLHRGKILADGSKEHIFSDPSLLREAGITPPEIYRAGRELCPALACYTTEDFLASLGEEA